MLIVTDIENKTRYYVKKLSIDYNSVLCIYLYMYIYNEMKSPASVLIQI